MSDEVIKNLQEWQTELDRMSSLHAPTLETITLMRCACIKATAMMEQAEAINNLALAVKGMNGAPVLERPDLY